MADAPRGFPIDWLADPAAPASDLELALLLVNSHDLLEEVPDRLADLTWLTRAFSSVGHADLVTALSDDDLPGLRDLRGALRRVFESDDAGEVAATLNPLLDEARALLVVDDSALALRVGVGLSGLAALKSRLPAAVASYVVDHGLDRLGVCGSDPCRCVFVDRTRAGTRKYCCTYCNDRYAARAYRRRKRS